MGIFTVVQSLPLSSSRTFPYPPKNPVSMGTESKLSPPPSAWQPLIHSPSLWICLFWTCPQSGIMCGLRLSGIFNLA